MNISDAVNKGYNMKLPVNYENLNWQERKQCREIYTSKQKYLCWFCGQHLYHDPPDFILRKKINKKAFPPNFFKWPIHLHHSHKTGLTIGAVHNYCNAVLWQYHGE